MNLNNIKNVIFDLGGVIIDLELPAAYSAFADLSGLTIEQVVDKTRGLMLFTDYEQGLISSEEFRLQIGNLLLIEPTESVIDQAWCAMLGGIPMQRLQLLTRLKKRYNLFALSNTNDIHAEKFDAIVEKSTGNPDKLSDYFEKVYYSHQMKMRKPQVEIYQAVLDDQGLNPGNTLFIDDNYDNINGADALGIQTLHLLHPDQLMTLFDGAH